MVRLGGPLPEGRRLVLSLSVEMDSVSVDIVELRPLLLMLLLSASAVSCTDVKNKHK